MLLKPTKKDKHFAANIDSLKIWVKIKNQVVEFNLKNFDFLFEVHQSVILIDNLGINLGWHWLEETLIRCSIIKETDKQNQ